MSKLTIKQNASPKKGADKSKLLKAILIIAATLICVAAIILLVLQFAVGVNIFGGEEKSLEGVFFSKARYDFEYDGNEKSVQILGLSDNCKVEYSYVYTLSGEQSAGTGNGFTQPGDYSVTAKVSKRGYKEKTLKCSVYINKLCVVTFVHEGFLDQTVNVRYGEGLSEENFPDPCAYAKSEQELIDEELDVSLSDFRGKEYSWIVDGIDFSCIKSDFVVECETVETVYNFTLELNGGSMAATINDTFVFSDYNNYILPEPVKEGSIFVGWFSGNGVTYPRVEKITEPRDYTLFAVWDDSFVNNNNLSFEVISGEAFVKDIGTCGSVVVIPDMYEDYPVVGVMDNAFENSIVSRVYFGKNIRTIGKAAFKNSPISELFYCNTIRELGDEAFSGTMLEEIIIPEQCEIIGDSCFYNCIKLQTVEFSEVLTTIGSKAFYGCILLDSVLKFPETLTSLGEQCFRDCSKLSKVVLPVSVTDIPAFCFAYCTGLTSIDARGLQTIGEKAFLVCIKLAKLSISSCLDSVDADAFKSCASITQIDYYGLQGEWDTLLTQIDSTGNQSLIAVNPTLVVE